MKIYNVRGRGISSEHFQELRVGSIADARRVFFIVDMVSKICKSYIDAKCSCDFEKMYALGLKMNKLQKSEFYRKNEMAYKPEFLYEIRRAGVFQEFEICGLTYNIDGEIC